MSVSDKYTGGRLRDVPKGAYTIRDKIWIKKAVSLNYQSINPKFHALSLFICTNTHTHTHTHTHTEFSQGMRYDE